MSERTIRNDAEFAAAVDELENKEPGTRAKVMRGEGPTKKLIIEPRIQILGVSKI